MAQRKYTSAAKGKGFSAITVSDANIQRMSQESNRIVEGMRARRDSDLENQRRILADMESNAAYSEKTRKRDFDIASTNIDTQRRQQQYNAQATQDRIRQEGELAAKIFDSVASLSATAAESSLKLRKEKEKEADAIEVARDINTASLIKQSDIEYKQGENEVETALNYQEARINALQKIGGYEHEIARIKNQTAQQSVAAMRVSVTQSTITEYQPFLSNFINDPNNTLEINGQQITYAEAQRDPGVLAGIQAEAAYAFLDSKNLLGLNPGFLKGAYIKINEIHQSNLTVATNNATKDFNDNTIRLAKNKAFGNFAEYGAAYYNTVANIYGHPEAHTRLNALAKIQNTDGTFVVDENDYLNLDVNFTKDKNGVVVKKGFKGTYKEDHTANTIATLNARETLQRQWATNQRTTERNDYQAEAAAWFQEYQNNPTRETLAAAEEYFKDNQQGNPEWLTKAKAALDPLNSEYVQKLKTDAKDLQARGMLNQPFINDVHKYFPKLGNELQESFDKDQNPLLKSNDYVGQRKVVEKINKQPTATNPNPKDNADSFIARRAFLREYDAYVKAHAAADGIQKASDDGATMLQDKVAKAKPGEKYYGKYNAVTGLIEFPHIGKDENLTGSEAAKEQAQQVQDAINDGRQQEIINKKYGVLTEAELDTEVKNINSPNYVPNFKLYISSQGVPGGQVAVLNKQLVLAEKDPIEPPESLARVGEYSPSSQKLLQRYLNANVATRVHGYEGNKLGTEWNRHLVPAEYRDMHEKHAETYGLSPAIGAALIEQPSFAGSKGISNLTDTIARQYGVDVDDPESSIKGMYAYMKDLVDQFGDPILAAGAYKNGPGRMQEYVQNGIPLPAETVNHMRKVSLALYKYSHDPRLLQRPELIRQGSPFNTGQNTNTKSTGLQGLASLVSSGEGSATSMFPSENYPEMLDMTIGEVVGFQKEKLRDGRKSAAVGSYQFLYPETAAQRAGLSLDDKFTPENQLKMFVGTLLNKPGRENVSALLQGTGDDIETAIDELSQEFASIEYRNGRSYYEKDGINKASISRDQVRAALISAREELTN